MIRQTAISTLGLAMVGLVICAFVGGAIAALIYGWLSVICVAALAAVGASRADGTLDHKVLWGLAGLTAWLMLCFGLLWWWRFEAPPVGRLLGMPPAMAVQLFGIFLCPMPFVAWLYASTFRDAGLTEQELADLRRSADTGLQDAAGSVASGTDGDP